MYLRKIPVSIALSPDTLRRADLMQYLQEIGHRAHLLKIHNLFDEEPLAYYLKELAGVRKIVLDYCLHDTPDTVKLRAKALAKHGVHAITVKAEGGAKMIEAAIRGANEVIGCVSPQIWVDTISEEFQPSEVEGAFGTRRSPLQIIIDLATLANIAGAEHVICSDKYVDDLRKYLRSEAMDMEVLGRETISERDDLWLETTHFMTTKTAGIVSDIRDHFHGQIWVDFKLHNTPKVAAERAADLVKAGAEILTVHAAGGSKMIQAIVKAAKAVNPRVKIWAISVLTSLDPEDLELIYPGKTIADIVLERALLAKAAGADGVVCSAEEVGVLARHSRLWGWEFVIPGTRYPLRNDEQAVASTQQKRTATQLEAVHNGATVLVIGSQVTNAHDRVTAFDRSVEGLELASVPSLVTN